MSARACEARVASQERALEASESATLGGTVGGEVLAQRERPAPETVICSPAVDGQVLEVGKGILCPGGTELTPDGQSPERRDDLIVEQRRRVQLQVGRSSTSATVGRATSRLINSSM